MASIWLDDAEHGPIVTGVEDIDAYVEEPNQHDVRALDGRCACCSRTDDGEEDNDGLA